MKNIKFEDFFGYFISIELKNQIYFEYSILASVSTQSSPSFIWHFFLVRQKIMLGRQCQASWL